MTIRIRIALLPSTRIGLAIASGATLRREDGLNKKALYAGVALLLLVVVAGLLYANWKIAGTGTPMDSVTAEEEQFKHWKDLN